MFDKVVLMKDGHMVYSGAPGKAIEFFAKNGWECPTFTNPADYVLDVISELGDASEATGKRKTVPQLVERFRKRQKKKLSDAESKRTTNKSALFDLVATTKEAEQTRPGFFSQFPVLFLRAWRNNLRHGLILWAQLGQHIILALFVGLMYLQLGPKSVTQSLAENATVVSDRAAAIFFALLNITFISAFTEAFVFPAERPIFNRERASGHYGVLSYYLALTAANLPLQLLFVTLNATVCYWMVGLRPDFGAYIVFVLVCLICTLCVQGATLVFSALSPSADIANVFMGLVMLIFMSFAGYFLSIPNIPVFFKPFEYISPYKYAYRALLVNDFTGITFNCTTAIAPEAASAPMAASNFTAPFAAMSPLCPYPDGVSALQYLRMTDMSIVADSMILLGMTVIYRIIVYIILLFVKVGGD